MRSQLLDNDYPILEINSSNIPNFEYLLTQSTQSIKSSHTKSIDFPIHIF